MANRLLGGVANGRSPHRDQCTGGGLGGRDGTVDEMEDGGVGQLWDHGMDDGGEIGNRVWNRDKRQGGEEERGLDERKVQRRRKPLRQGSMMRKKMYEIRMRGHEILRVSTKRQKCDII